MKSDMLLFGRYKGVKNEQTRKTAFSDYGIRFFLWTALFLGAVYVFEKHFPDAAFFRNDNGAMIWVWLCGSVVSFFCGWLIKDRLKSRLSQKSFDLLEIGTGILLLIVVLLLNCLYKYGNY